MNTAKLAHLIESLTTEVKNCGGSFVEFRIEEVEGMIDLLKPILEFLKEAK